MIIENKNIEKKNVFHRIIRILLVSDLTITNMYNNIYYIFICVYENNLKCIIHENNVWATSSFNYSGEDASIAPVILALAPLKAIMCIIFRYVTNGESRIQFT